MEENKVKLPFWEKALIYLVVGVIAFIPVSMSIDYMHSASQRRYDAGVEMYNKYNPVYTPALRSVSDVDMFAVMENGDTINIPKWTDCNGDYEQCRKNLKFMIETMYAQPKYKHHPESVHFMEIVGDTLKLLSISFKDVLNRMEVKDAYSHMFADCHFAEVRFHELHSSYYIGYRDYDHNGLDDKKEEYERTRPERERQERQDSINRRKVIDDLDWFTKLLVFGFN